MIKIIIAITLALTACLDTAPLPVDIVDPLVEICGPRPGAPGWYVRIADDLSCIRTDNWLAIEAWRDETELWGSCVERNFEQKPAL